MTLMEEVKSRHVGFRRLTEHRDTTSPSGQLIFHIVEALAEFDRHLIHERTLALLKEQRYGRVARADIPHGQHALLGEHMQAAVAAA